MPRISGELIDIYDIRYYGAQFDGATDDTSAWTAALAALAATGGTLRCPPGVSRINGQIVLPNDSAAIPNQKPLRITGAGAYADGSSNANKLPVGGTILDLRYDATGADTGKIVSLGTGKLEIDHVAMTDGGTDTTAFLYITNTVLLLHHCSIYGNKHGQDAVRLGGANAHLGGLTTDAFQGYGTVIDSCDFHGISRAAYLRAYANGIQIVNNSVWSDCAGTAPFELDGTAGGSCFGNYFSGNLIECAGYVYGFKLNTAARNSFIANHFYDELAGFLSYFNLTNSTHNIMLNPMNGAAIAMYSGDGSSANSFANLFIGGWGGGGVGFDSGFIESYGSGNGNPEGVVTGALGRLLIGIDGNLYIKKTSGGNTGWHAVTTS